VETISGDDKDSQVRTELVSTAADNLGVAGRVVSCVQTRCIMGKNENAL
jgi:hypothetical protein